MIDIRECAEDEVSSGGTSRSRVFGNGGGFMEEGMSRRGEEVGSLVSQKR
jgi:hypothetical protein